MTFVTQLQPGAIYCQGRHCYSFQGWKLSKTSDYFSPSPAGTESFSTLKDSQLWLKHSDLKQFDLLVFYDSDMYHPHKYDLIIKFWKVIKSNNGNIMQYLGIYGPSLSNKSKISNIFLILLKNFLPHFIFLFIPL